MMGCATAETILIVEDDEGVGFLQGRALERHGFQVSLVKSADEALAALDLRTFDLAILDYLLPGVSTGLDLYSQMKAAGHHVPVIFVTGFSDQDTVIRALRAGASDFITKSTEYLDYLPEAAERVLRQRRLERQLAETQIRFQSFMDNGPAVILFKNTDGNVTYVNRQYELLFPNVEWHGKTEEEALPGKRIDDIQDGDQATLTEGSFTQRIEGMRMPNGQLKHWLTHNFPLTATGGESLTAVVAIDVTARTQAEEALRQRDLQLRQAQKMEAIGTLAGGVAHEFNNLLQAIQGYTIYAMNGLPDGDERRNDLQQVIKASERATTLTRQLLGFSRREVLRLTDLDPNEQVRDLVKMLRPLIGADIEVQMNLAPDVGMVHADAGHLQQLLMNLCVNARDAMPHGGKLLIKTEDLELSDELAELRRDLAPGRYLVLSVTDTGCGMSPEVRDRIFEPFFTTKGVGKGTGLGLPMVYGVVRQHNGTVRVYSELGVGTSFRIYLPVINRPSENVEAAPRSKPRGGNETILVAEDDPMVRDVAVRILERAGYRTITAADGVQAVELFEKHQDAISLAIIDMVMPRLSGREVYQSIKQTKPQTQIVFCSGYDPEMTGVETLPDQTTQIVQKPFDPEKLLDIIRDALDNELCLSD
jgi:PAS domain S-box-containing protein